MVAAKKEMDGMTRFRYLDAMQMGGAMCRESLIMRSNAFELVEFPLWSSTTSNTPAADELYDLAFLCSSTAVSGFGVDESSKTVPEQNYKPVDKNSFTDKIRPFGNEP